MTRHHAANANPEGVAYMMDVGVKTPGLFCELLINPRAEARGYSCGLHVGLGMFLIIQLRQG